MDSSTTTSSFSFSTRQLSSRSRHPDVSPLKRVSFSLSSARSDDPSSLSSSSSSSTSPTPSSTPSSASARTPLPLVNSSKYRRYLNLTRPLREQHATSSSLASSRASSEDDSLEGDEEEKDIPVESSKRSPIRERRREEKSGSAKEEEHRVREEEEVEEEEEEEVKWKEEIAIVDRSSLSSHVASSLHLKPSSLHSHHHHSRAPAATAHIVDADDEYSYSMNERTNAHAHKQAQDQAQRGGLMKERGLSKEEPAAPKQVERRSGRRRFDQSSSHLTTNFSSSPVANSMWNDSPLFDVPISVSVVSAASRAPLVPAAKDDVDIKALQQTVSALQIQVASYHKERAQLSSLQKETNQELLLLKKENKDSRSRLLKERAEFEAYRVLELKKMKRESVELDRKRRELSDAPRREERSKLDALQKELKTKSDEWKDKEGHYRSQISLLRTQNKELNEKIKNLHALSVEMEKKKLNEVQTQKEESTSKANKEQGKERVARVQNAIFVTRQAMQNEKHKKEDGKETKQETTTSLSTPFRQTSQSSQSPAKDSLNTPLSRPSLTMPSSSIFSKTNGPTFNGAISPSRVERTIHHDQGKIEMRLKDGSRVILFPNGTRKLLLSNGDTRIEFECGDWKETHHDHELLDVVYFYAARKIVHTSLRDGTQKYLFANGQSETHFTDGSRDIVFADGARKFIHSDGYEEMLSSEQNEEETMSMSSKFETEM